MRRALSARWTFHILGADRGKVCEALKRANLDDAYNRWINESTPLFEDDPETDFIGSFPIATMQELTRLIQALTDVPCETYLWGSAGDDQASCAMFLHQDRAEAEWTCDEAVLSKQMADAIQTVYATLGTVRFQPTVNCATSAPSARPPKCVIALKRLMFRAHNFQRVAHTIDEDSFADRQLSTALFFANDALLTAELLLTER